MTTPTFSRNELANILGVTVQTIANREKRKEYPTPKRQINKYRYYEIDDVLLLQMITFSKYDPMAIAEALYEKGYKDTKIVANMIDKALSRRII